VKHSTPGTIAQPELRLLLACARIVNSSGDGSAIRRMLEEGIDWTAFARKATNHGVANLVGNTMERIAPDMVPEELRDALRMSKEFVRSRNDAMADGLRRAAVALANCGIEAIWFKGPVLGIRAYGDSSLRVFGAPTLLIREQAAATAIAALCETGYQRKADLTGAQLELIRHLQGHEMLSNPSLAVGVCVVTRLTPLSMAFDIDHEGLWRRAQVGSIMRETLQTLAPEDELLASTIRDRNDGAWGLAEACDFARLIASQPELDWDAIVERARAQGSLRVLVFAVSLARRCFDASIADAILPTEHDPIVEAMISRTVAQWQSDEPAELPAGNGFSRELLRLHQGRARRSRYLLRSLALPAVPHVSRVALPRRLSNLFVYALIKVVEDAAILPVLRTYRELRVKTRPLRDLLASHEVGLALIPVSSEQRGLLRRYNAARAAAKRALAENPRNPAAWQDLGNALFRLERHAEAIAAYDEALASAPEDLTLWRKRAATIRAGGGRLSRFDTEEEAARTPRDADAWARHAASLAAAKRFAEAAIAVDRALAINPRHLVATRVGIRSRILSCDWRRSEDDERRVANAYKAELVILTPAGNRAICDSEAQNLVAAQLWARPFVLPPASPRRRGKYRHDRIRLAYVCSEYHDHPVGRQIVGVLEHHDRSRFETTAISLGGASSSAIRQRIQVACDQFVGVHDIGDEQVAGMMSEMEIDIAIDLDRFAARARPGILARRPAALQVTYFGNAGTTGAPFIDYIVADRTLIPSSQFDHYTEKVIYLPNSYQCNDSKRHVPQSTPSRAQVGLPEAGFVYCCFNQHYKIRPAVFDVWMRLLHACPGSVLWLLGGEAYPIHNLRREAAARGIAVDRLVFAPRVSNHDHIARHRLADLFLDTLPCNAHATASDALWAGLPMLTCLGNTFAGRVGGSLLRAVGLPEMVTDSLPQYEAAAKSLATDPQRLAAIRARLERNRDSTPLFDTAGFTRDLEAAFEAIWRRQQADLAPEAVAV
jgi:protein O-GlcNAc transferase